MQEFYIGLDVHGQSTTCVALNPMGKRMKSAVVETSERALVELVCSFPGARHVCFEEGTASSWVHDVLLPHAVELVCCMPRKRQGPKSDVGDAEWLAESLRRGTVERRVFKGKGTMAELREAVRGHRVITQDVARVKNRLRAVFRGRGVMTHEDFFRTDRRDGYLLQLKPPYRELAELMFRELDGLVPLRAQVEDRLLEESSHHAAVDYLKTIPGIGPVRAAYIVGIVVTPQRFRSKRQFWAYCGLAVVTESSGDWKRVRGRWVRTGQGRTRGLNMNRNPYLKDIFKGAALSVVQLAEDHPARMDYQQMILRGMRPHLARLTMARRLAATALALWKKQEVYDYSKRHRPPNPRAASVASR